MHPLVHPGGAPPGAGLALDELLAGRGGSECGHEVVLRQRGQRRGEILAILRKRRESCVELEVHTYIHTYIQIISRTIIKQLM